MQSSHRCPLCNTLWEGDHYVGEKAITTSASYRNSRPRNSTGRPRPVNTNSDDEQSADEEHS